MISNALPGSLVDNPLLSQWIAFAERGRVRVGSGKVEIGQGIVTALTQIAAEELDITPEQVDLVSGQTDISPDEWFTSGSYSVSVGGASIRLVCAEVRALLLDKAAALLGCDPFELTVEQGRVLRDGRDTGHDYWSLSGGIDLQRKASGAVPVKPLSAYRVVGRSLPRLDLPAKIRGEGFIHDMAPSGVVHARVLRQPWRGARLALLDETAVRKAARAPIDILRIGDFVAFTAENETAVMRAGETARQIARWEGGAPPPDDAGTVDWLKRQPAQTRRTDTGSGAPAEEGRTVEASYSRPFLTYGSIGPSCALAEFKDGRLTVCSHCQGPGPLRDWLAKALGLDREKVTVRHRQGAGAYGHNSADDAAFDAAFLATQMAGRTIRVQWAREDEFLGAPVSPAMVMGLRAVLDDKGRPAEWSVEIWSAPHVQRPGVNGNAGFAGLAALPDAPALKPISDVPDERGGGATRNAFPIYDLPRYRQTHHMLTEPPVRTSSLRGLGAWANVFAIESFIDELAETAGADPVAYRLSILTDPRARRVLEAAASMSGWADKAGMIGEGRALGVGLARYKNIAAYSAIVVEVSVDEAVRLERIWCAADAGLVINPDGAKNQLEGGIIQGASFVMREEVRYAGGRVANEGWDDYPILRFSDVPEIDIELVGDPNHPALGLGECSVGPTGGAIGNALARALGRRIRALPLTRDRIMAALLAE